jgi:hypothetical protein
MVVTSITAGAGTVVVVGGDADVGTGAGVMDRA